jgi:hypothetical protein
MKPETFLNRDSRLSPKFKPSERGMTVILIACMLWFIYLVELNELAEFAKKAGWPPIITYGAPQTPAQ